ncbi:MAG: helix-turn-helix transcriptional regulator [Myxococcota bacterium]
MQNTFGDAVYRRRKALGMTQEALADKVGVKPTYIGYLERGKRHASPKIAGALADVLGLNRSYLFLAANPVVKDFLNVQDDGDLNEMPQPQALIDLRQDEALRSLHSITDADVKVLERMAFLGEPRDKMDYLLLLQIVRKVFAGRG